MKALILAAGTGTRLGSPCPKTLRSIGGRTVLGRTLGNLHEMGIESRDVRLVTGFREELLIGEGVELIHNPLWRFPGTLGSFFAAGSISEELLVIHGDLVWETDLLRGLQSLPGDILIPLDPRTRNDTEAMKAEVRCGRVLHLSKRLPPFRSAGESMGVFLIRRPHRLREIARNLLWKPLSSLDDAVNAAAGEMTVKAFFSEDTKWEEIDTPQDVKRAEELFSE